MFPTLLVFMARFSGLSHSGTQGALNYQVTRLFSLFFAVRILEQLGRTKAIELFKETKDIESKGGMMVSVRYSLSYSHHGDNIILVSAHHDL